MDKIWWFFFQKSLILCIHFHIKPSHIVKMTPRSSKTTWKAAGLASRSPQNRRFINLWLKMSFYVLLWGARGRVQSSKLGSKRSTNSNMKLLTGWATFWGKACHLPCLMSILLNAGHFCIKNCISYAPSISKALVFQSSIMNY